MNEKILVICDSEIRYANSLAENIAGRRELNVKVHTCSSIEKVLQLLKEKEIHIFVVDEKYKYEDRCRICAKQTFVLSRGKVEDLGTKESAICKYQCADEIIRLIFERYVEKTNENIMRSIQKERTKLIAVYSPIHRVGKTRFAIALGKAYARKERVLYLNMEEYAGFTKTTGDGMCLGDVLYYVKQGNENLGARLQAAARKMGDLDYIEPISMALDLKEISLKEWEILLEQIKENSTYERVILDIGESVQGLLQILSGCDRIYMPVLEDEVSQKKLELYRNNLEQLGLEKIAQVTYQFIMPENIEEYAKIRMKEEL